ncbi:anti-Muellerian hormone type-2 receptor [Pantherophis guttatus]|uniref:receptor protein serine/threonine kinase n=1 Tax=Pantherophis guttatus TaxID=94885 RepID=A0A6P9BIK9_PANGU|nr:anti-Muellerian hormone type-2 receptor [Pantherophis guttatus]
MGFHSFLLWLLMLAKQSRYVDALSKNRSCVSYGSNALTEGLEHLQGLILEDGRNGTIQCPHNQCCFGIWDLNQGQLQAKMQGCWISEKEACDSPACEFRSSAAITLSCRCRSDLCNANISYAKPGNRPAESLPSPAKIAWITVTCLVILLCFSAFPVLRHRKIHAVLLRPKETGELNKVTTGSELKDEKKLPRLEVPDLQFIQLLHEGQLSKLWQGTFSQQPVAIKAFPPLCHQQFASEWAVYSLPLMNHENVARLVTAGYGGPSEEPCGLLVLTLYPLGSLRNFLSHHICSWDISIQLGSSLASGLAFLHEEKRKEGLHKPGVAHRDLSSQNVLVREDRTCVITDFGFAMTLPLRHEHSRKDPAEAIVHKAGAQRYVAPEILDENLNLQDVGSALRQADVYSLALVLWEILMRCSALFPENNIPPFQLAYETELGSSPTYSELRRLAVEERRRPIVPPTWTRFGQVAISLQELLEDCWDPEPDARLQAECALQRLQRLGTEDLVNEY